MQGSETPHQIDGVDPHDAPAGEEIGQDLQRLPIVGIVEGRHQHRMVANVEVRVAGRQPHAVDLVWGLGTLHCMTQQEPKAAGKPGKAGKASKARR